MAQKESVTKPTRTIRSKQAPAIGSPAANLQKAAKPVDPEADRDAVMPTARPRRSLLAIAAFLTVGLGFAHAETGVPLKTVPYEGLGRSVMNFEYCGPSASFPPNDCDKAWICREPGTATDRPYICVHNWADAEKRCDLDNGKRDYMCTEKASRQ